MCAKFLDGVAGETKKSIRFVVLGNSTISLEKQIRAYSSSESTAGVSAMGVSSLAPFAVSGESSLAGESS